MSKKGKVKALRQRVRNDDIYFIQGKIHIVGNWCIYPLENGDVLFKCNKETDNGLCAYYKRMLIRKDILTIFETEPAYAVFRTDDNGYWNDHWSFAFRTKGAAVKLCKQLIRLED